MDIPKELSRNSLMTDDVLSTLNNVLTSLELLQEYAQTSKLEDNPDSLSIISNAITPMSQALSASIARLVASTKREAMLSAAKTNLTN